MAPKPDHDSERAARLGDLDNRIVESRNISDNNGQQGQNCGSINGHQGTIANSKIGPRVIEHDDVLSQVPSQEKADVEAKRVARANSSFAKVPFVAKKRSQASSVSSSSSRARFSADSEISTSSARDFEKLDRDIEAKAQARLSMTTGKMIAKTPALRGAGNDLSGHPRAGSSFMSTNDRGGYKGPALIPGVYEEKNDPSSSIAKKNSGGAGAILSKDIVFGGVEHSGKASFRGLNAGNEMPKEGTVQSHSRAGAVYEGNKDSPKKAKHSTGVRMFGADDDDSNAGDYATTRKKRDLEADLPGSEAGGRNSGMGGFGEVATFSQGVEPPDADNLLAVAREVEEAEEDTFIPAAVEFDPDAKPPIYKSRRFRIYGCLASLLLLVVILAIVIPTSVIKNGSNTSNDLTSAPTSYRESLGIKDQLEIFVGASKLDNIDSPHYKALDWLLHEDDMQLTPEAENLVQRYAMAVFYFTTSVKSPWLSCNPPTGNQTAQCMYQRPTTFWPEIVYEEEPDSIRWLSDKHECECELRETVD